MPRPAQRLARCVYFGRKCQSETPSRTDLPFFERRLSADTVNDCAHCGYAEIAHRRFSGELRDTGPGTWPHGLDPHPFEMRRDGDPFDRYYCGCWGWE
jgi:hypothetical protein